jgi:nicotinamidase-related amidase
MKLDPKKTALLTLDFQKGILGLVPGSDAIIANASKALEFARTKKNRIIHVGLGFSPGHPEIPDHSHFQRVKQNNLFVKGTESAEFHSAIARPEELVVYKQRVGAFSENQLHLILRSLGIENLVFFGISTSGITLSTLRRAFDLDYKCTILKDACFDADAEVHRVLTEKIFPAQATVVTVDAFIAEDGTDSHSENFRCLCNHSIIASAESAVKMWPHQTRSSKC